VQLIICFVFKSSIDHLCSLETLQVTDVAFSEDGSMFVTVGNRHVKFWYLDASKSKVSQKGVASDLHVNSS